MAIYDETTDTYTLVEGQEDFTMPADPANGEDANAVGNELANTITGNDGSNTLYGEAGDDSLVGGLGSDRLIGGEGADTLEGGDSGDVYIVDESDVINEEENDEGYDRIEASFTVTLDNYLHVEDVKLTGTADINGTGNEFANEITGNSGNNILNGGAGADTMIGGLGNDTYIVDSQGDLIIEEGEEGHDTVRASVDYELVGTTVENLILTGEAALGRGNDLDNRIEGNSGADVLYGGIGNDTLVGGFEDDLNGGDGDDVYIVSSTNLLITETDTAGAGTDRVEASVSFDLSVILNVENLTLTGTSNINGTGNDLANTIVGNDGNNVLDGKAGADHLFGGKGNDTYVLGDTDTIHEIDGEGTDTVEISDAFTPAEYTLQDFFENLVLKGSRPLNGTGNAANNLITGNSGINVLVGNEGNDILDGGDGADDLEGGIGDDMLVGGVGADVMKGGEGNDLYFVDSASDVVTEEITGGNFDRVIAKVSHTLAANVEYLALENGFGNINGTGNTLDNTIFGNDGNNVIDGAAGADQLSGAGGNDTVFGGNGDDTITEFENGNDVLNGGEGNDDIRAEGGNDTLDGGTGADTLKGGAGDDLYMVDSNADMLIEDAGQGTDTIIASASYTLRAGVAVELLSAQQGGAAISLTGNEFANTLSGNAGNNTLDGGAGADMLAGSAGDDTYMVDNALDVVTESAGQGTDTIIASINLVLTAGSAVEVLAATAGGLAVNLTGNETSNTVMGNDGANILNGGLGKDVLSGGGGADIFVFDKKANKTNLDRISDYDVKSDSIYLESSIFKKIGKGTLSKPGKVKKDFFSLKGHKDKNDYLAYNKKTGVLTFDADGSGKTKAVEIATLDKKLKMTEKEFFII